ncbi:MAG: hypothetical protein IPL33_05195 [Sphingobacteriales bacterium]|nr:hypothetical protein [Sphingobacteriales bacterium]
MNNESTVFRFFVSAVSALPAIAAPCYIQLGGSGLEVDIVTFPQPN